MKMKRKCPVGRLKPGWKQIRKYVIQKEGRAWEEIEKLWEDRDRWGGGVIRQPT
jgi:hypothetical protein